MRNGDPSLMDVHGALSALCYAVKLELEPLNVDVRAHWSDLTHLSVTVETYESVKQIVIDRLSRGAITGGYDYRFKLSYPTMKAEPYERVIVTAYPDLCERHLKREKVAA